MMYADQWNYFWYWSSYGADEKEADDAQAKANWWHKMVYSGFAGAIISFTAGSLFMAFAMTHMKVAVPS